MIISINAFPGKVCGCSATTEETQQEKGEWT